MQKTKRVRFTIRTKWGKSEIPAYSIGQGLYVHRSVEEDGQLSTFPFWTVSAECGFRIARVFDRKVGDVIEGCKKLYHLDWTEVHKIHHIREKKKLDQYGRARKEFKSLFEDVV